MELKGKIEKILEVETGISKAGKEWSKQSLVIKTEDDFNNLVCVSAFGDKVKKLRDLKVGMDMTILCNIYSREYNGKYYHNIDGYHFTINSNNELSDEDIVTFDDDKNLPF